MSISSLFQKYSIIYCIVILKVVRVGSCYASFCAEIQDKLGVKELGVQNSMTHRIGKERVLPKITGIM